MKPISTKTKLALVGAAYAAVLAYAAAEEFHLRYLQELNHPADVMASSGMYAGGDMMLEAFVAFLLMIPNFLLGPDRSKV